ncbi:hypothetical protein [Desulfospira joergensenii]|uniref:hypothetical protein n=1 Tax=Desulfospira joergensenii TaxID=53329 RepID=UPI0003B3AE9E|nr:hypothetical protein [Desulfospira joergensenii]
MDKGDSRKAKKQDSLFTGLKDQFLVAAYEKDPAGAERIYQEILDQVELQGPDLRENDEKTLRQIRTAFKRFSRDFPSLKKEDKKLGALLRGIFREQSSRVHYVDYNTWSKNLNLHPWQEHRLFETAITFQMTKGCSNFCRRCNEWALPKIRAHFSKDAVVRILEALGQHGNRDLALYGASDPLDWEDPPHGFEDILSGKKIRYSILTKAPKGKNKRLKSLVQRKIPFSVSLTARNRNRVTALERETGMIFSKQHDSDDLLIPAGQDEDFTTVKPSITDAYGSEITPEGAFIILPAFTSALSPMGHEKLVVSRDTPYFPVKLLGRRSLLKDYFKPLEVLGPDKTPFFLDRLLDVQVESILLDNGTDELTPPGMRSLKEYFSIFDDGPRTKRKKMTRSVILHLKQKYLSESRGYRNLPKNMRHRYRAEIRAHLDFCDKDKAGQSKLLAASFFLNSVVQYLAENPVRQRIVCFLIRDEMDRILKKFNSVPNPEELLTDEKGTDPEYFFQVFRALLGCLVLQIPCPALVNFIDGYPSKFDPVSDRFIPL